MMLQIGYFSTATGAQDATTVHQILLQSRQANARDGVTGLLVAAGNRYLQVIEGPPPVIESLYDKIEKDGRHRSVTTFARRKITERSFDAWAMAFRRRTQVNKVNSFDLVLNAFTARIPDDNLRRQIRYFANANMAESENDLPPARLVGRGVAISGT